MSVANPPTKAPSGDILSLRVQRACTPLFATPSIISYENTVLPVDLAFSQAPLTGDTFTEEPIKAIEGVESLGFSELLAFPPGFGSIYVGETFKCHIHFTNECEFPLQNVAIVAELGVTEKPNVIDTSSNPLQEFLPSQSAHHLIKHLITEEGFHVFSIVVNFELNGAAKQHRKLFKFFASPAVAMDNKVIPISDGFAITTEVTNKMKDSMFINLHTFEAAPGLDFTIESLNPPTTSSEMPLKSSLFQNLLVIQPESSKQIALRLKYKDTKSPNPKGVLVLGRVLLRWAVGLADRGEVRSEELTTAPYKKPISVVASNIPATVFLGSPFQATFTVTNRSEQRIRPRICTSKNKMLGIHVIGISGELGPKIGFNQSCDFTLTFVAVDRGLQQISGLKILDTETDKSHEFPSNLLCFVEEHPSDPQ